MTLRHKGFLAKAATAYASLAGRALRRSLGNGSEVRDASVHLALALADTVKAELVRFGDRWLLDRFGDLNEEVDELTRVIEDSDNPNGLLRLALNLVSMVAWMTRELDESGGLLERTGQWFRVVEKIGCNAAMDDRLREGYDRFSDAYSYRLVESIIGTNCASSLDLVDLGWGVSLP